jgi:hypothetical protein
MSAMLGAQRTVGQRRQPAGGAADPVENYHRGARLILEMERLNPWPRPRGFIFKARSWDEYARWRASQKNPRLW